MAKTANEIFLEKIAFMLKAEETMDASVKIIQRKLYTNILQEFMPKFKLIGGFIANTASNLTLLRQLDIIFDGVFKALNQDVLGTFASSLLKSTSMSAEYFVAIGFKKTVVDKILKDKVFLEKRLGISGNGSLRTDGYLYQLGKTDQVRQELKNYALRNLTGDVSYLDFQKGFKELVVGQPGTNGSLQRYFDQYAYDTFNEFDEVANGQIAIELQLKHFVYEGSTIATSRKFCIERAGKAYTIEETKDWKNDANLIDKKTKESYSPLIERGRYRCRHFIKYITETVYKSMKNIDQ